MAESSRKTWVRAAAGASLLVCAFAAVYAARGWMPGGLRSTSSRIAEAQGAYEQGNYERASELARSVARDHRDNVDALRLVARTAARLGRDSTSSSIYSDRLKGKPLEAEDYFVVGLGMARAGRFDSALELFMKAEAAGPPTAELLEHVARLSARQHRLDQASAAARRLAAQPGWEARGFLLDGEIRSLLDDPPGTVEALRRGLKLDPEARGATFAPSHFEKLLARGLLRLGRPAEAVEPLQRVLGAGADPEADWLLSRAYLGLGKFAEAASAIASAAGYRASHPAELEPSPYVGEARCTSCHAAIARNHAGSRHARTFQRGKDLLALELPAQPLPDPDEPRVTHAVIRKGDALELESKIDGKVYDAVVRYAFGLPDHYVSMIAESKDGVYRALRLSHYHRPDGSGWGRTAGDLPGEDRLENLRGEPIDVRDGVVRCLYCHTTDPRAFREPPPPEGRGAAFEDRGIGCERCHGPGANHLAAVKGGLEDRAIVTARATLPDVANDQCIQCHITGVRKEIEANPEDPKYVRSTGVTMSLSRCYLESKGALTCLTCHDPHRDDDHAPAGHEAKCLGCHLGSSARQKGAELEVRARQCKVNPKSGCLDCHMPKVPVPVLRTSLTDHYIRIRKSKTER